MATKEVSIRPSPAQVHADEKTPARRKVCNHCRRPIAKGVTAARKAYCGRLCAALGLIATVDRIGEIDDGSGVPAILQLVKSVFYEGPTLVPVTVRDRDSENVWDSETFPVGPEGTRAIVICIDDDGTPDWAPDPILDAQQEDVDYAVDMLLLPRSPLGGAGATL